MAKVVALKKIQAVRNKCPTIYFLIDDDTLPTSMQLLFLLVIYNISEQQNRIIYTTFHKTFHFALLLMQLPFSYNFSSTNGVILPCQFTFFFCIHLCSPLTFIQNLFSHYCLNNISNADQQVSQVSDMDMKYTNYLKIVLIGHQYLYQVYDNVDLEMNDFLYLLD